MKRIIALSFALCLIVAVATFIIAIPQQTSLAQSEVWLRVTEQGAWFYKNATGTQSDKMFELAYSYYIKAVSQTENGFYAVELMENANGFVKLYGYVDSAFVTQQTQPPLYPTYPVKTLTVTTADTILFSSPSATSASVCGAFVGQNLYYYGTFPSQGESWYFVRYGQNLCYVAASAVSAPNISLHPTPMPIETPVVVDPIPTEPKEDELAELQIALIVLICVPGIIVVIILFLPTKSKKQNYIDASDGDPTGSPPKKYDKVHPKYFDDYL